MGGVKTVILPVLKAGFQGASNQISSKPLEMLARAKNRICPSLNCKSWANMRRQASGDKKGKRPSITSTRASAIQTVSLLKRYFFAGPTVEPPLRKTLKNSDEAGSSTITSLLLAKLAL
jgi:hypothetical protein